MPGSLTAAESVCRAALLAGVLGDDERARAEATLARILLWQGRIDDAAQRDLACPDADHETAAYVAGDRRACRAGNRRRVRGGTARTRAARCGWL